MAWVLLVHDPVTIISELGFPIAIALLVFYALKQITNQFTSFLMEVVNRQSKSIEEMGESLIEVRDSMREMTQFLRELNGKLRGGQ